MFKTYLTEKMPLVCLKVNIVNYYCAKKDSYIIDLENDKLLFQEKKETM